MKDTLKFALMCLGLYGLAVALAFMFSGALVSETTFVRYLAFAIFFVALAGIGFFEGGSRGEADSAHERRMRQRQQERGEEPTPAEKQRYYRWWKGLVASLIAMSPVILLALYMLIAPALGWQYDMWQTPVMRLMLWPYITLFSEDVAATWIYLPLSFVFPAAVTVGYLMGPNRFAKFLRTLNENNMRKRRSGKKRRAG